MKILISILFVCILLLSACSPSQNNPSQNNVPTTTTTTTTTTTKEPTETCKMVDVPYQVSEEEKVDYKYQVLSQDTQRYLEGMVLTFKGVVMVKNTEKIAGNFTVTQTFTTTKGKKVVLSSTQSIMGGEAKPFNEKMNLDDNERAEMTYVVTPAKKTIAVNTVTKYVQEKVCTK